MTLIKRAIRMTGMLAVLAILSLAAWLIDEWTNPQVTVVLTGQQLKIADGDSFTIGAQRFRLDGIDAPEYRQTCTDQSGKIWACGIAARASLEQFLRRHGLSCVTGATDQYGRAIATCSAAGVSDISAAQVFAGMAVTHEYFGIRDYGDEQDLARSAKRGIWVGKFAMPSEWRKSKSPSLNATGELM